MENSNELLDLGDRRHPADRRVADVDCASPSMTDPVAYGDLSQLAGNLAQASGNGFEETAASLMRQAANDVAQAAKARAPRRTGALADSITVAFTGPTRAVVGPKKKYGVFQELGTKGPYKIRPRRASHLRFEVDGKVVFAKEVTHPGLKARPFMRPAVADVMSKLQDDLGTQGVSLILAGQ